MNPNPESLPIFDRVVGAYVSHTLSEVALLTLLYLASDTPPHLKSSLEAKPVRQ